MDTAYNEGGAPAEAIAPLQEAIATYLATSRDPSDLAAARFELACALWASRRDRPRARALAREAAAGLDELPGDEHLRFEKFRVEVEAWITAHGR